MCESALECLKIRRKETQRERLLCDYEDDDEFDEFDFEWTPRIELDDDDPTKSLLETPPFRFGPAEEDEEDTTIRFGCRAVVVSE